LGVSVPRLIHSRCGEDRALSGGSARDCLSELGFLRPPFNAGFSKGRNREKHRIGVGYVFESYDIKKTQELLLQRVWMLADCILVVLYG
jgi:hypothetical protein